MAAPNEIVVSTHEDGSPYLVVGAGLSPREADVIMLSDRPDLLRFVTSELGVSEESLNKIGTKEKFLAQKVKGKLIIQVSRKFFFTREDLANDLVEEVRALASELPARVASSRRISAWLSFGSTGGSRWNLSPPINVLKNSFFDALLRVIVSEAELYAKVLITGPPETTPDGVKEMAEFFARYVPQTKAAETLKTTSQTTSETRAQIDGVYVDGEFETFDDDQSPAPPSPPLEQKADFRSDRPITDLADDALDRVAIARAIYEKVHTFWTEGDGPPPKYPFMVHIAGRWGSGKSTILNFLGEILRNDESLTPPASGHTKETRKNWVVVTFNAWQHQAQRPAWWSLYNAVADQSAAQMEHPARFTFQDRWFRFLINGGRVTMFTALAVTVLFFALLGYGLATWEDPQNVTASVEVTTTTTNPIAPDTATTTVEKTVEKRVEVTEKPNGVSGSWDFLGKVPTIAAFLAALIAIGTVVQKFLQRTQDIAEALVASDDPTAKLKQRFEAMIREIHRPVAIFIDDLDRCDADYVVELLQAVQTIYVDVPVLYVVAADRDWIVSAYDQSYEDFKGDIDQPGQPLGYLFVKKIFQLSVNIPDLDSEYGRNFLTAQLKGNVANEVAPDEAARIRAEVQAAPTLAAAQKIVEEQASPAAKRVAGTESFSKYMTVEAQLELQHVLVEALTEGEMLLDPNPRAIKRLVNAYSFRSGFALIAGDTKAIPKLPYWCALDLRFPYSAERLMIKPDLAANDKWRRDGQTKDSDDNYVGTNTCFPEADHDEIAKLLAHLSEKDIKALRIYG